ncbi:polyprenol monophosphomannose synthase [Patescibacteria group bacterium]|nr:polyprenol monophosphomannose synthase [Patescibacteria group bacterium]
MIYVVIPTYNEAGNVERLVGEIRALDLGLRVLIVDDSSPDGTGAIVERLSREMSEVEIIHNPGKVGLGKAYIEGLKYVCDKGADAIVTMDADFSHNPRYIPELLDGLRKADVVIGSRHVPGAQLNYPWFRKTVSRLAVSLARWLMGLRVRDSTSAFRCFNKEAIQFILERDIFSEGYVFLVEVLYLLHLNNFKIIEIPIVFEDRVLGESKMSAPREIVKGVRGLLRLRMRQVDSSK